MHFGVHLEPLSQCVCQLSHLLCSQLQQSSSECPFHKIQHCLFLVLNEKMVGLNRRQLLSLIFPCNLVYSLSPCHIAFVNFHIYFAANYSSPLLNVLFTRFRIAVSWFCLKICLDSTGVNCLASFFHSFPNK
jgi:hypothetical protein